MINQTILKQLHDLSDGEIYDIDYGDWMVEQPVETRETLDDFMESSKKWNETGVLFAGKYGDFDFIGWDSIQAFKGQTRNPLTVMDLGDCRITFRSDIYEHNPLDKCQPSERLRRLAKIRDRLEIS